MDFEYEITDRDYIRAHALALKNSPIRSIRLMRFAGPLFGAWLLLITLYAFSTYGFSARILPAALAGIMCACLPMLNRVSWKKRYAKDPALHGKLSLNTGEDGIAVRGASFESKTDWSVFNSFFEDRFSFVLFQNQQCFTIIPKSRLSADQVEALRNILKAKISSGTRILQASA